MKRPILESYQPFVLVVEGKNMLAQFRHYDSREQFNELRISDPLAPWIENGGSDSEKIVDCSDPTIEWRPLDDEENDFYLAELDKKDLWIDPFTERVCHKGMTIVNYMDCFQEVPCVDSKEEALQNTIEEKARFYEMLAQDVREHPERHGFSIKS